MAQAKLKADLDGLFQVNKAAWQRAWKQQKYEFTSLVREIYETPELQTYFCKIFSAQPGDPAPHTSPGSQLECMNGSGPPRPDWPVY